MRERATAAFHRLLGSTPQFGLGQAVVVGKVDPCGGGVLPRTAVGVLGQLFGGTQPGLGGAEPPQRLCVVARGPVAVVPGLVQGVGCALHRLGRPLQLPGVAHLGALAQGGVLGVQAHLGLVERGEVPLGRLPFLLGLRVRGLCLGEVPLQVLVARVLGAWETGPASGGNPGVAPVVVQEGGGGPLGGGGGGQFLLLLVQGAERLGHVGDDGLVHGRQRLGEGAGEGGLVGALGQLGLTELDKQVDESAVPLLAEPEQCLVHGPAVGPGLVVHHAVPGDRFSETISGERGAGGVDKAEGPGRGGSRAVVDALAGDRVPVAGDAASADGLQSAQQRTEVVLSAGPVASAELDPGVAEAFGVRVFAAEEQVPLHPLSGITVRFDTT